jgi:iron complex transport system substrate-binding protein
MIHVSGLHPNISKTRRLSIISRIFYLIVCINLCFIVAYADGDSGQPYPRTVTDDSDSTVTLTSPPQRIVSLAPSNTEILFSIGLDDRVIGVTDYCTYPPRASQKEKVGGFSTVSIERVAALSPDLVVASDGNNPDTVSRIRSLGITVYYVDAKKLDDVIKTLTNIGYLTGALDKADQLTGELKKRYDLVKMVNEKTITHQPVVAHAIWNDPLYVSGAGTFQDEIITICGGKNAFGDKEGHHIVSIEEFVTRDPDLLIINAGSGMGGNDSSLTAFFRTDSRLSGLKAIKNNSIMEVDSDIADRSGPRLWDLLEITAPWIQALS